MSDLVCIRHFYDPEEAFIARGALRAGGINASLPEECALTANPGLRIAVGGYRLLVPQQEEEAARNALADALSNAADLPIGAEEPCPNCGGKDFRRLRNPLWSIIAFLCGSPFGPKSKRSQCLGCGDVTNLDRRTGLARLSFRLLAIALLAYLLVAQVF